MLHRITEVFADVTEAFESYQFFRFFQTVQNFCVVDLSNFYLDIAKGSTLYFSASLNALRRRSCQTVLAVALENFAKAIAPVSVSHGGGYLAISSLRILLTTSVFAVGLDENEVGVEKSRIGG